jgi:hypothetical protein
MTHASHMGIVLDFKSGWVHVDFCPEETYCKLGEAARHDSFPTPRVMQTDFDCEDDVSSEEKQEASVKGHPSVQDSTVKRHRASSKTHHKEERNGIIYRMCCPRVL